MRSRILVTGAAGFIGSNLTDHLLLHYNEVMGIDNFDCFYGREIKESNLSGARRNPKFSLREGDIRDPEFLDDCISGFSPGLVIHLAARAGVTPSLQSPADYYSVNVMGTVNILESMKRHRIHDMIFASSSSVYGNNLKVPFSESDKVDFPVSPYAASKKAGELLCFTYHHLYNFNIFCLRFFTVYGPRQRPDLAICRFTKAILNNNLITLYGDGSSRRDYTHVSDIVKGIESAVLHLKGYDIFNIGGSDPVTLIKLISIIEKHAGLKANVCFAPFKAGDVNQTYADIGKAYKRLNFKPAVDLDRGIQDYVLAQKKSQVPGVLNHVNQ